MISINADQKFTVEMGEDKRLPNLDMKMWSENLTNGLVRRLSNINIENVPYEEVVLVTEQFNHVIYGLIGWRNKIEMRKREGQ